METRRELKAQVDSRDEVWKLLLKVDDRMGKLERAEDWTSQRVNSLAQDLEDQVSLPHNSGLWNTEEGYF